MSWGCSRRSAQRRRSCVWQQLISGKEEDVVLLASDYVKVCSCPAECGYKMAVRKLARWMLRERYWILSSDGLEASVSVWAMGFELEFHAAWSTTRARSFWTRCSLSMFAFKVPYMSDNNRVEKWRDRGRSSWQIRKSDLGEHVGEHGCGSCRSLSTTSLRRSLTRLGQDEHRWF